MPKTRCSWCENQFDEYKKYHDNEWGLPNHDDKVHFEFLILEGAQAGLSWSTILKKREGYRTCFADFEVEKVANFSEEKVQELLQNPSIIRNKLKIRSAITNAQRFIEVQKEFGSFDKYVWSFVGGSPTVNQWKEMSEVPPTTPESDALSKDLKKRGFKFVGSTIMYAYMQACGLVNDHIIDCFRYNEV
ncbi:MAG: DNA-3-methyladenine glycosylase I [Cyclobacteriaceae bacterium]|nr:DNA-3-methyladenine glycosylase I [Cyclobacteriaceae bacterium]